MVSKKKYIVVQSDGKWMEWTKNPMTKSSAEKLARQVRKQTKGTGIKVSVRRKRR